MKIFISHSTEDKELVKKFHSLLNRLGVHNNEIYCTSNRPIEPGINYVNDIQNKLKKAKLIVFLISPNFIKSSFCMMELGMVFQAGYNMVPILIPPISLDWVNSTFLNQTQMLFMNKVEDLFQGLYSNKLVGNGIINRLDLSEEINLNNDFSNYIENMNKSIQVSNGLYNSLRMGNVNDRDIFDFYEYCLKNSNNIKMISPTANSWIDHAILGRRLRECLKKDNFHIEFIVLNQNSSNFESTIDNIQYLCETDLNQLHNIDMFKYLIKEYPSNIDVYISNAFVSNTITIDCTNEVMRVDNHIWYCNNPHDIKPCIIIPNNKTDINGYYDAYIQQYDYIKLKSKNLKDLQFT